MTNKFLKIALLSTLGFVSTNAVSAADSVLTRMISIAEKGVEFDHSGDKQIVAARGFAALYKAQQAALKAQTTAEGLTHEALGRAETAEAKVAGLESTIAELRTGLGAEQRKTREAVAALEALRAQIEALTEKNRKLTAATRALSVEAAAHRELDALNDDDFEGEGNDAFQRSDDERARAEFYEYYEAKIAHDDKEVDAALEALRRAAQEVFADGYADAAEELAQQAKKSVVRATLDLMGSVEVREVRRREEAAQSDAGSEVGAEVETAGLEEEDRLAEVKAAVATMDGAAEFTQVVEGAKKWLKVAGELVLKGYKFSAGMRALRAVLEDTHEETSRAVEALYDAHLALAAAGEVPAEGLAQAVEEAKERFETVYRSRVDAQINTRLEFNKAEASWQPTYHALDHANGQIFTTINDAEERIEIEGQFAEDEVGRLANSPDREAVREALARAQERVQAKRLQYEEIQKLRSAVVGFIQKI